MARGCVTIPDTCVVHTYVDCCLAWSLLLLGPPPAEFFTALAATAKHAHAWDVCTAGATARQSLFRMGRAFGAFRLEAILVGHAATRGMSILLRSVPVMSSPWSLAYADGSQLVSGRIDAGHIA